MKPEELLDDPNADRLMLIHVTPHFLADFLRGKALPTETNLPADAVIVGAWDDRDPFHGNAPPRGPTKIMLLVRSREFERHTDTLLSEPVFDLVMRSKSQ